MAPSAELRTATDSVFSYTATNAQTSARPYAAQAGQRGKTGDFDMAGMETKAGKTKTGANKLQLVGALQPALPTRRHSKQAHSRQATFTCVVLSEQGIGAQAGDQHSQHDGNRLQAGHAHLQRDQQLDGGGHAEPRCVDGGAQEESGVERQRVRGAEPVLHAAAEEGGQANRQAGRQAVT